MVRTRLASQLKLKKDRPKMKDAMIAAGIPTLSGAKSILKDYRAAGCRLRHPSEPWPRGKGPSIKLEPIREWLLESLHEHRFLSLERRCEVIQARWDIQITRPTLSSWYKRNKVRWTKPNYHLANGYPSEAMQKLQQEFCVKLLAYWMDPTIEIIFIDEASCHAWNRPGKMWMDINNPYLLHLTSVRGGGCQMQAAISNRQPHFKY